MDIFFKDNLNSSDQLYIEQLLCASMAASTDNTGSWGITPALTDILDADGWWFAASDPDLISKSCPVSKTYLSGCMAVYQTLSRSHMHNKDDKKKGKQGDRK